jgi:hypothetical protein
MRRGRPGPPRFPSPHQRRRGTVPKRPGFSARGIRGGPPFPRERLSRGGNLSLGRGGTPFPAPMGIVQRERRKAQFLPLNEIPPTRRRIGRPPTRARGSMQRGPSILVPPNPRARVPGKGPSSAFAGRGAPSRRGRRPGRRPFPRERFTFPESPRAEPSVAYSKEDLPVSVSVSVSPSVGERERERETERSGQGTKRQKFTHNEILEEADQDPSNFVVVLGETKNPGNVPWWVYVIMHTQKAKRFKCRTHVGRSKNPFRKEVFHNLKALKRCKVTRPAAGHWKLCMVVGPFMTEGEACDVVKEWRKSKRAEYGRHAYGMNLCMNSDGRLLCFSNLLTEDVSIEKLNKLPPEYLTPFKSSPIGNQEVALLLDSKGFRKSSDTDPPSQNLGKRKNAKTSETSGKRSESKRSKTVVQSKE